MTALKSTVPPERMLAPLEAMVPAPRVAGLREMSAAYAPAGLRLVLAVPRAEVGAVVIPPIS